MKKNSGGVLHDFLDGADASDAIVHDKRGDMVFIFSRS